MSKKKTSATEQVAEVKVKSITPNIDGVEAPEDKGETVLVLRATRTYTVEEHEAVSAKLRYEQEKSGVRIILIPFTCEPDSGGDK